MQGSIKYLTHMKKILVVISLFFAGIAVNAQWYVEGALSFDITTEKSNDGDKLTTRTEFDISESLGYYVNDKFDIGFRAAVGFGSTKNHNADTKTKSESWVLAPYVRYSFLQFNKFEVIARGELSYSGRRNKNNDGNITSENKTFSINVVPVLAYNLTDHLVLTTALNFARCGFDSNKVKNGRTTNSFGFNFESDNALTLGAIQVGFLYKF